MASKTDELMNLCVTHMYSFSTLFYVMPPFSKYDSKFDLEV
jgi:hypothetical protein